MTHKSAIRDADHSGTLKRDALGSVRIDNGHGEPRVLRQFAHARRGLRWLARRLARREAHALDVLAGLPGVPALIGMNRECLTRSLLPGSAMHKAAPPDAAYFRHALRLVRRMHRAGVVHNDLAKEANWIRLPDGRAGIVDFQLAVFPSRRGRLFRLLAREDLRHLFKHKRHYLPSQLTSRQVRMLETPAWPARLWRRLVKPPYRFITRRLLGWTERDGAFEREY